MPIYQPIVGQQFGRLTALEEYKNGKGQYYCRCICTCGKEKITSKASLMRGNTRSCGCLHREIASAKASGNH